MGFVCSLVVYVKILLLHDACFFLLERRKSDMLRGVLLLILSCCVWKNTSVACGCTFLLFSVSVCRWSEMWFRNIESRPRSFAFSVDQTRWSNVFSPQTSWSNAMIIEIREGIVLIRSCPDRGDLDSV